MAKKRSTTSVKKSQIEDTFNDLDVTLTDGLEENKEVLEDVLVEEKPKPIAKKITNKTKAPGIYYNGELVDVITHQTDTGWRGFVKGKKVLGAPSDFEVVE
jgi:hypothetical protein